MTGGHGQGAFGVVVLVVAGVLLVGMAVGGAVADLGPGGSELAALLGFACMSVLPFGVLSRLRAGIVPDPRGWLRPLDEPGYLVPYRVDRRRLFMVEGNLLAGAGLIGVGLIVGAITEPTLPWLLSALVAIVMLTTAGLLATG